MKLGNVILAACGMLATACLSRPNGHTGTPAAALVARDQPPTMLTLPNKQVEVLGLRRWTLAMIQDSLDKYAPGENLASHACAAILRYKLGFVDAASLTFLDQSVKDAAGRPLQRVTVSVMEPQDSARVRSRLVPQDSTSPYEPWARVRELVRKHPQSVSLALQLGRRFQADTMAKFLANFSEDSAGIRTAWLFQSFYVTNADFEAARHLLKTSPDMYTRVSAVLVVGGFGSRDAAAHALVEAMLESDGYVKGFAGSALEAVTRDYPRKVNWNPVAPEIHAMLDGTSLFQLGSMLAALGASRVDTSYAAPFLANGGRMLLNYFQSAQAQNREPAHRLLVALRGQDLGSDVEAWRAWIRSL